MARATKTKRIGLALSHSLGYCREILRGVKHFAESRPGWLFIPSAPDLQAIVALRSVRLDGIIAHVFNPDLGNALAWVGKPVVNVAGVLPDLPFVRVVVDHQETGRLAAEHLLDRGLRHFGFVGYPDHEFSLGREEGFRRAVEAAGCSLSVYHERETPRVDPTGLWSWNSQLRRWVGSLPRPAGILASHDIQGVQLAEACLQAGLRVPEDMALVGVDDDDLLCELARPPLSSVALPAERIGYEAAAILDALMTGTKPVQQALTLSPIGVVTRQSSDVLAIDDPDVAAAIRFIRGQAHLPIHVADVLRAVPVCRRRLERGFRRVLDRGLWEEILNVRLTRARDLLSGSDAPVAEVARRSGFPDAKQFCVTFRREMGLPPTAYRRKLRGPN